MDALVALFVLLFIVMFLWKLTQEWFGWAIHPVQQCFSKLVRATGKLLWSTPARIWGTFNVAWAWLVIMAIVITLGMLGRRSVDWFGLCMLWLFVAAVYKLLRDVARWRLRPRAMPRRRRGGT